ncbi:MAG: orotate phosphoribosyltransferase [Candidatus Undinarchaeales archaeon]
MNKKEIAEILLDIGAVILRPNEPFIFTSGIKSPIYCDNRLLMSHVEERREIIDSFEELLKEKGVAFDVIAGTATAGIPHAAWLSERENSKMIYVRSSKKGHGKENKIEGVLQKDQKVLVVEDLVSTGGSSIEAVQSVRDAGGIVDYCIAIFTYGLEKAEKRFDEADCNLITLTDFETLIETALERGDISKVEKKELEKWQSDPDNWMK